jgi:hypothetical protein
MSDTELWKPYPANPKFEVSNMGNVRRTNAKSNIIPIHRGRHYVITDMGYRFTTREMVAETWLHGKDAHTHVRHKNGNAHDNRVTNLEWYSIKYNNGRPRKNTMKDTETIKTDATNPTVIYVNNPETKTTDKYIKIQDYETMKWKVYKFVAEFDEEEHAELFVEAAEAAQSKI